MSLGAKLAIVAATAALTVGLFFVLRSSGDDDGAATTPTVPGTTAQGPTTPGATAQSSTAQDTTALSTKPLTLIELTVKDGKPVGGIATPKVTEGDQIGLIVTADVSDQVHVDGYDLSANVAPGTPTAIHFTADKVGRFEIALAGSKELLAELSVEPR